jgi:hypothetical protein
MLMRILRRIGSTLAFPPGLCGAFLALVLFQLEPAEGSRVVSLLLGWLYGVAVAGLMRFFRVAPWAYPLLGLLCGPVPFALLVPGSTTRDERGALWAMTAVLGLLIGLLEWARESRRAKDEPAA